MENHKNIQVVAGKNAFIIFGIVMTAVIVLVTFFIYGQRDINSVPEKEIPNNKVISMEDKLERAKKLEYNEQSQKVYYVTATANVRECASTTCKILFTLPINHEIKSPYQSLVFMPEWLDILFDNDDAVRYINKVTLSDTKNIFTEKNQTEVSPVSPTKSLRERLIDSGWHPETTYVYDYTEDGYVWAEENDVSTFEECQDQFGTGYEEDECNRYVKENYSGYDSFGGYECTEDCSGHEAGYAWAEENGISDEYDCDGNSNSFNEGCMAYVEENY